MQDEPHQQCGLRGLAPALLCHPQLPAEAAEQGERGLRGGERRRLGASGNESRFNLRLTLLSGYHVTLQGDTSPGEPGLGSLGFCLFHPLPGSAWPDGKLAELAEQLGKMVEHPKSR